MFGRGFVRAARSKFVKGFASSARAPAVRRIGALGLAAGLTLAMTSTVALTEGKKTIPHGGLPGTPYERSFIAIKPDGIQRGLIGEIIARFEKKGFKLVALKLITPTPEIAAGHYDDLKDKPFFGGLVNFFSSGPVVAMVWEGSNVIKTGRQMLGATNPAASMPGTIRGDYAIDVGRNVCHGSDGPESAAKEIGFWFSPSELYNWTPADATWKYEKL